MWLVGNLTYVIMCFAATEQMYMQMLNFFLIYLLFFFPLMDSLNKRMMGVF